MKYSTILFDFDGTLFNTEPGIIHAFTYALDKMGVDHADISDYSFVIGPPMRDTFKSVFGMTQEEAEQALAFYRERYKDAVHESFPYDGVTDMLDELKKGGLRLMVATSKPTKCAELLLREHKLDGYFEFVSGAELDGTRDKKSEVVDYAVAHAKTGRENVLMVGDRKYDVVGAGEAGIKTLGVAYGFGTRDELMSAGAIAVADTPADVVRFILCQE